MVVVPGGPGWGCDYFIEPMTRLFGERHHLVFVDQRGAGWSPVGVGPLTMNAYVEDLVDVCDALGFETVDMLGHSFGGLQAMHFAVTHQDRLSTLVLVDANPPTRAAWNEVFAPGSTFARRTMPADVATIEEIATVPEWYLDQATLQRFVVARYRVLYADPQMAETVPHGLTGDRFLQFEATNEALFSSLGEWDITAELSNMATPTLLVYCRDSIFDSRIPDALVRVLPDAVLRWVDGGHLPSVEDPETYRLAVEGFFAMLQGSR